MILSRKAAIAVRASAILLLTTAGFITFLACGGGPEPTPTERPPVSTSVPGTPLPARTPTPVAGGDEFNQPVQVVSHVEPSIKNLELSQRNLWVSVGATITWTNDDLEDHTITSRDGWFDQRLAPGESFSWQPDQPGVFTYYCAIHENVQGTIIVSPGGAITPQYYGGQSILAYYQDSCAGCHSPDRRGATGPALLPETLPDSPEFYKDTILHGRFGTIMPAWGMLGLSEEEAWGLVGFLKSRAGDAKVAWGLEDIANSLTVLIDESSLPSEPTHSGNIDNLMLVTERENRSIALIDGDTHTLITHIDASYRAHGYVFDSTDERWAYNLGRDGWLFKIDLYTGEATRKVRVGHDARGLAISDDGKYVIAGNYLPNSAVIVDAKTLEPLKVFETSGVNPDGELVDSRVAITSDVAPSLVGPYFLIALKEAGEVWRIDFSDPSFPVVKIPNVGRILHDGFLSPDNRFFYLAAQNDNWMAVIDVANAEVVEQIETGAVPHPGSGATWEADGTHYGATVHAGEGKVTIWDLGTNEIVGTVETEGPGLFIRAHDHSPYVWADALFGSPANTVTVFEKEAPFNVVGVIEEGVMTLHPEFTNDGRFVYISDWQGNVVRVYDAETLEKVAEIGGVTTPTGIFNTERRLETLGH